MTKNKAESPIIPINSKSILARELKVGQWLAYSNGSLNMRIVDTFDTPDGQIKVYADFGHGGEPATLFFEASDKVLITS